MKKVFFIIFLTGFIAHGKAQQTSNLFQPNLERIQLMNEARQFSDSLNKNDDNYIKPFHAALYSALVPGLGEYMSGSYWKAALFATVEVFAWTGYFIYTAKGDHQDLVMKDFANLHWSEQKYWSKLYYDARQIAQSDPGSDLAQNLPQYSVDQNTQLLIDYDADVVSSLRYLERALGHTHELPATKTQQYYEMIYKYLLQFGNGWDDADFFASYDGYKNILTPNISRYRDLRNTTDELYDMATHATWLALVNHVASAFDAALTARKHDRQLTMKFRVQSKPYFGEQVNMYGVTFGW